jgi:NAD(P) transhydrogenase
MIEQFHEKPKSSSYDLVVIGSGPGGQRAAVQAAKLGKTTLVIEKDRMGGSCLHTGTIPSKTLREAALDEAAIKTQDADILRAVMSRTREVIENESAVIERQLSRNKVEYVGGLGSLGGSHTVHIRNAAGSFDVKAQFIVIATGTTPRRPTEIPFDSHAVFDSDTILEMSVQPKTMAVIGAGVIGCEYASIYARMGVKVSLIDRKSELLPSIDPEITSALGKQFEKSGIEVCLGADYKEIKVSKGLKRKQAHLQLLLAGESEFTQRQFEAVLVCVGRTGNVEHLNLNSTGIEVNDRGLITVNSNYQTSTPSIYAVGDIIGAPALAASSAEQGRLAVLHAFQNLEVHFPTTFPYGIYTIPEISSVGAQESELKLRGTHYVVGRAHYREIARGKILADETGFLKLLVDRQTARILGVHVIGSGATELVHIGQTAMAFNATIDFFVDNVFNYPTLAEAYKVAALHALNQLR